MEWLREVSGPVLCLSELNTDMGKDPPEESWKGVTWKYKSRAPFGADPCSILQMAQVGGKSHQERRNIQAGGYRVRDSNTGCKMGDIAAHTCIAGPGRQSWKR